MSGFHYYQPPLVGDVAVTKNNSSSIEHSDGCVIVARFELFIFYITSYKLYKNHIIWKSKKQEKYI